MTMSETVTLPSSDVYDDISTSTSEAITSLAPSQIEEETSVVQEILEEGKKSLVSSLYYKCMLMSNIWLE